ncbi:MAG TPA: ABC transporter permease, partial [Chthoniobacteraceae bacterium]|nr:ABC transporter permease [Chthoniobacteraceae bacterium]
MAWAEVLHVVRDHATLAQVLLIPIVQLLVLTNAATFEIRDTPTYVVDLDRTPASRGLVTRLAASGHFHVLGQSASADLANDELLSGKVTMVATIPHNFEQSLMRTGTAPVQLTLNAEKGPAAGIVQFYAGSIIGRYSEELTQQYRVNPRTVQA